MENKGLFQKLLALFLILLVPVFIIANFSLLRAKHDRTCAFTTEFIPTDEYLTDKSFVFVLYADNSLSNIEQNMHSIFSQKYDKYRLIIIHTPNRSEEGQKFIDAIAKRKSLLIKVTLYIAERQKSYLLEETKHLEPLQLSDLAEAFDVCTSTISRAIANKSIDTPLGTIKLQHLLSREIAVGNSKQKALHLLKQLIEQSEEKKTDAKLSEILYEKYNIKLSRRTVAKYRNQIS